MSLEFKKLLLLHLKLRLIAQSVTLLNTLRDPTQLRRRQCGFPSRQKKIQLGIRGFRTFFWEVEHPLCDVVLLLVDIFLPSDVQQKRGVF